MADKKETNPHKNVTILYCDKLSSVSEMYLELKDTSMLLKTTFRSEFNFSKIYENVRRHKKMLAKDKRALCEVRERTRSSSRLKNEKKNVDEARSSMKIFF